MCFLLKLLVRSRDWKGASTSGNVRFHKAGISISAPFYAFIANFPHDRKSFGSAPALALQVISRKQRRDWSTSAALGWECRAVNIPNLSGSDLLVNSPNGPHVHRIANFVSHCPGVGIKTLHFCCSGKTVKYAGSMLW